MATTILPVSCIYAIRNLIDGKSYVGSTLNLKIRIYNHRSTLNTGKHCNAKLSLAWAEHGSGAFEFAVLEPVQDPVNLIAREQYWIDRLDSARGGYNVSPTAGSSLGCITPPEVRAKQSAAQTGVKKSPEHVAKVAAALRGRPGTRLGAVLSPETRAKMSAAAFKRVLTDEERNGAALRSANRTPEQRSAQAHKAWETKRANGLVLSEESRQKMRDAQLARYKTP